MGICNTSDRNKRTNKYTSANIENNKTDDYHKYDFKEPNQSKQTTQANKPNDNYNTKIIPK